MKGAQQVFGGMGASSGDDNESGGGADQNNARNLVLRTQALGVLAACSASMTGGLMLGFPARLIPDLQEEPPGGPLHITLEQGSWIREYSLDSVMVTSLTLTTLDDATATLHVMVLMVCCPFGGVISTKFGRRYESVGNFAILKRYSKRPGSA